MKKGFLINLLLLLATISYCQQVEIPDAEFKKFLISEGIDKNGNQQIEKAEAEQVTNLDVSGRRIYDLTGLEAFINLISLNCSYMGYSEQRPSRHIKTLNSLDISKNTKLKTLDCSINLLPAIDISNNPDLETLVCYDNQLKSLNISNNKSLTFLSFGDSVERVAGSENSKVKTLHFRENVNTQFDFSAFTELESAYIQSHLSDLNLNSNSKIKNLTIVGYLGTTLDITNLIELDSFNIYDAPISQLDLTKNTKLSRVALEKTILKDVNFSQAPLLKKLLVDNNSLTSLDLTKNPVLEILDCSNNNISALDISKNISLKELIFHTNQIKGLNLSGLKYLRKIDGSKNQLNSLDISNNNELEILYVNENNLVQLDVSNNIKLKDVALYSNKLFALDVTANLLITNLTCDGNPSLNKICISKDSVQNFYARHFWSKDYSASFSDSCKPTILIKDSISIVNIPDPLFKQALIDKGVDQNNNGKIEKYEALIPNKLVFQQFDYTFSDMTGIEAFANLEYLSFGGQNIVKSDISQNTLLKEIYIINTKVDSVNTSKMEHLNTLQITSNPVKYINTTQNKNLSILQCNGCFLKNIDVTQNTNLTVLELAVSTFNKIDLSKNLMLTNINLVPNDNLSIICVSDYNSAINNQNFLKPGQAEYLSCDVTGIEEESISENTISLFPNPTRGTIYLNKEIHHAVVYNHIGEQLFSTNNRSVDLSNYTQGYYFIRGSDVNQKPFDLKIIKRIE